ncbi:MAG: hypothetical protein A3F72_08870 [Bacteroidetes bacterium RIFCSPLOWO2_12_FULL_35_15]|nr:MAG: hypothetical protein A3F72_08870 [Bacteroidetes bacterium RIFCSPLOWO2_12_FULL_35_15]
MEHIIKIGIQASSKQKAEEIATDLLSIRNSLNDADLKALAQLLKTNPSIITTAKNFLGK